MEDCPYKGLAPFTQRDAAYFFGREKDAERIAATAATTKLTVLFGPSGVGKSSVLGAALPEAVHKKVPGTLLIPFARWEPGFYTDLKRVTHRLVCDAIARRRTQRQSRRRGMSDAGAAYITPVLPKAPLTNPVTESAKDRSLARWAALCSRLCRVPVIFVFDQFEQHFVDRKGACAGRDTFGDAAFEEDLALIAARRNLDAHVLISIREDALFELNRLKSRIPYVLSSTIRIDYLDEASARRAIREPLMTYAACSTVPDGPTTIEDGLVESLIEQVARDGKPVHVETPYLQLALEKLWNAERSAHSLLMRRQTLDMLDGARGIATRHFLETIAELSEADRRLCAGIFRHMVTPSGMKVALSAADLAALSDVETPEVQQRVEHLLVKLAGREAAIVRGLPSPHDNTVTLFEIVHDVLAKPIVEWTHGFEAELEHAEDQRRIHQQQEQIDERARQVRKYRRLSFVCAGMAILMFATAVGTVLGYREAGKRRAELASMQAEQAIASGDARLGLLVALRAMPDRTTVFGMALDWIRQPLIDDVVQSLAHAIYSPRGRLLTAHADRLSEIAYSANGTRIATASEDRTVRLWNAQTGRLERTLPHKAEVTSATFVQDQPLLLTVSTDGWAHIWDEASGAALSQWPIDAGGNPLISVSPSGAWIATASYAPKQARLWRWHPHSGSLPIPAGELSDIDGRTHGTGITSLSFDRAGELIVTTAWDGSARVWDANTRQLRAELPVAAPARPGHTGPVLSAAFSPEGRRIATASRDRLVRVWELPLSNLSTEPGLCIGVGCSGIVGNPIDGALDARLLLTLTGHDESVSWVTFEPSGGEIYSASTDGTVRTWNAQTGDLLRVIEGPAGTGGYRVVAALRPDSQQLVASFSEKVARVWDLSKAQMLDVPSLPNRFSTIAVSRREPQRMVVAFDQTVRLIDATVPGGFIDLDAGAPVMSVALSENPLRIAAAAADAVLLWTADHRSGLSPTPTRRLRDAEGGGRLVLSVAFDPSGDQLAAASQEGVLRIWRTSTGKLLLRRSTANDALFSAAFSRDGGRVVAGSFGGAVRIWDVVNGSRPLIETSLGKPVLAVAFADDDQSIVATVLENMPANGAFATATVVLNTAGANTSTMDDRVVRFDGQLIDYSATTGIRMPNGLRLSGSHRDAIRLPIGASAQDGLYTISPSGKLTIWRVPPAAPVDLVQFARRLVAEMPADLRSITAEDCRRIAVSDCPRVTTLRQDRIVTAAGRN